jgi:hypothetical protein
LIAAVPPILERSSSLTTARRSYAADRVPAILQMCTGRERRCDGRDSRRRRIARRPLPVTFPANSGLSTNVPGDTRASMATAKTPNLRRLSLGDKENIAPLFAFGHGLSHTRRDTYTAPRSDQKPPATA